MCFLTKSNVKLKPSSGNEILHVLAYTALHVFQYKLTLNQESYNTINVIKMSLMSSVILEVGNVNLLQ